MLKKPPCSDYSFNFTEQERKRVADYSSVQSLQIWPLAQQRFGQTVALKDPHAQPEVDSNLPQLYQQIHGLQLVCRR